jgi:hypothetical protein
VKGRAIRTHVLESFNRTDAESASKHPDDDRLRGFINRAESFRNISKISRINDVTAATRCGPEFSPVHAK